MEIREIKEKTYLINDFYAIKIISITKVNDAWANSSPISSIYMGLLGPVATSGALGTGTRYHGLNLRGIFQ